ncbi:hypothetical protein GGX14DRAFT_378724, partial [Mycena pura]
MPAIRRRRRRLLCAIILSALAYDDEELLPVYVQVADSAPNVVGCIAKSRRRRHLRGRPRISGNQITLDWLKSLRPCDCLYRFRWLSAHKLERLVEAMDIPDPFKTSSGYVFSAIEALCLLLARFKTAGDIYDLTMHYNRGATAVGDVVNELAMVIDERWKHLLDFDTAASGKNIFLQYAEAIHEAGAPLDSIRGFIECTIRAICRPSRWQRQAYNGHKKYHAIKYQAVKL